MGQMANVLTLSIQQNMLISSHNILAPEDIAVNKSELTPDLIVLSFSLERTGNT